MEKNKKVSASSLFYSRSVTQGYGKTRSQVCLRFSRGASCSCRERS